MSTTKKPEYENNPFNIGLAGLTLLFKLAQSVAILAIVLIAVSLLGQMVQFAAGLIDGHKDTSFNYRYDPSEFDGVGSGYVPAMEPAALVVLGIFVATILFIVIVIAAFVAGIFDYTAARISDHKPVSLSDAAKASWSHLPAYLWMNIVRVVKTFLWTLLLIIPGIIMSIRYSLAGVVFFKENERGNAATIRSANLTKGAVLTTYASSALWNFLTLGMAKSLISTSTSAVLYRQLAAYDKAGVEKPKAHWLTWLTVLIPPLFVLMIAVLALIVLLLVYTSSHGSW
jgi:hypothetical protein